MKIHMSAVMFRMILGVLIFLINIGAIGAFFVGYSYLKGVSQNVAERQAEAKASEDSIANLQRLQIELRQQASAETALNELCSSDALAQFDTERSLRAIAGQLGLPVKSVTFVNDEASSANGTPAAAQNSSSWGGPRNSKISFEFDRPLSYTELIAFLDAIETSTPKLRVVSDVSLPSGSNRTAVSPGSITLELATQ